MIQTLFGSLEEEKKTGFLDRMKQAVTRTRENLAERIEEVVSFGKEIDRNTLDDLEATLIAADLGQTTTQEVLEFLVPAPRGSRIDDPVSVTLSVMDPVALRVAPSGRPKDPQLHPVERSGRATVSMLERLLAETAEAAGGGPDTRGHGRDGSHEQRERN